MIFRYHCHIKDKRGFALTLFVLISAAIIAFLATTRIEQDIMLQSYLIADQKHYQDDIDQDSEASLLKLSSLENQ